MKERLKDNIFCYSCGAQSLARDIQHQHIQTRLSFIYVFTLHLFTVFCSENEQ